MSWHCADARMPCELCAYCLPDAHLCALRLELTV
jgi:hypothetical protein